jgi:hypothetical protein
MNQIAVSQFVNVDRPPTALLAHPNNDNRVLITARKWAASAGTVASLISENGLPARRAQLHISIGCLPDPSGPWGARFWEKDAPAGTHPVEWLLTCDSPVCSIENALKLLNETPGLVTALACC